MAASQQLTSALQLAKMGVYVFPIKPNEKHPPLIKWSTECSCDPKQIQEWWKQWPEANYGIACGVSGLVVVDLDTSKGKNGIKSLDLLELENGELPVCPRVTTPSGGVHLYFKGEAASTVEKLGGGIDTRGDGGYVVGPGSVTKDGKYVWKKKGKAPTLPNWVATLAGAPRGEIDSREALAEIDEETAIRWATKYLSNDVDPAIEGEGGDARTYGTACTLRDRGLDQQQTLDLMLEHFNPRCEPPWDGDEMAAKVEHAYRYAREAMAVESPEADFDGGVPSVGSTRNSSPAVSAGTPSSKSSSNSPSTSSRDAAGAPSDGEYGGIGDEWVWVAGPKWFVRRSDCCKLDKEAFDSLFNHMVETGRLSEAVFKGKRRMRRYKNFCFKPLAEEFCGEDYNLWRPSGAEPIEGGAPWFEEHISFLCNGRDNETDLVLNWLAHAATRPDYKMGYALLIQGGEGLGKSWVGRAMRRVIGARNVIEPSNEILHGQFNAWAVGSCLCIIHELMASGRRDMANKLKPLITDRSVMVEEKYRTPYEVENAMNFLLFTNWEDPIPIGHGDRRYLVVMAPNDPKPQAYYDNLWGHLRSPEGPGLIAGALAARDLSSFEARGRAPATSDKETMRRASMGEAESMLLELYEQGEAPLAGDLITIQDLIDALPDRVARKVPRLANALSQFVKVELRGKKLGQHRVGGHRMVLWSIRRHDMLSELTPVARSARYSAQISGATMAATEDFEDESDG